ncbi:MAG: hypothetical protein HY921_11590 [Elusimicrobia bacterium]|nr:hypothetical protein [Elusimicrobiota bacterium]
MPGILAGVGIGYLLLTGLFMVGKLLKLMGGAGGFLGGIFVLANLMLLSCGMLVGLGASWNTRLGKRGSGGAYGI